MRSKCKFDPFRKLQIKILKLENFVGIYCTFSHSAWANLRVARMRSKVPV